MFAPKSYGPPPGMESLEERRARAKAEAEAREAKLREIEAMRGRKVRILMIFYPNNHTRQLNVAPTIFRAASERCPKCTA